LVVSIAKTGVCLIDATGPGKAGQKDSLAAGHGGAERNRGKLDRAVTAISEVKAHDLSGMDFSKKPRVLELRDFSGDWIDQLSLARDQLAAVKLSGRMGEEVFRFAPRLRHGKHK
jgi:hypothetical protein